MAASSDEQKKVDFKADLLMTEGDSSTDNSTAKKVDLKTGPFKTEGDSSIDNRLAKKVGFTADPFATAGNSSTDIVSAKSSNAAMVSAMTHSQTLSSLPQSTKSKDEFIDINAPVPHSKPIDIQKPRASTIAHTGIYRLDELTDVIADIGDLALDEESTLYLDTKQPKVKGQGIAAASQSKANTQAKDDKEKGPVAQALDPKTEDTDANAQESSGYDPDQTYDYYNEEDYIGFDDDEEEEEDDAAGDDGEKKATTVEDNDDEDDAEEWLESAEAEWARLNQG